MASFELLVSILGPADAGELLTLRRAAFAQVAIDQALAGRRPEGLLQDLGDVRDEVADSDRIVLGGRSEGRLIASIRLDVAGPVASLAMFAVAPDVQHQGVGMALLQAVPEHVPDSVGEVRISPLPGTSDAASALTGYQAGDLVALAMTSAYLRRIGAD